MKRFATFILKSVLQRNGLFFLESPVCLSLSFGIILAVIAGKSIGPQVDLTHPSVWIKEAWFVCHIR
jgi:hypothetical protein